jgi:hypothetical protein
MQGRRVKAKKHLIIAAILAVLLCVYCLPDSYLLDEDVKDADIMGNELTGTGTESGEIILDAINIYQPMLVCTYWRFDSWRTAKEYYRYPGQWYELRRNEPVYDLAKGRPFRGSCPSMMGGE